MNLKFENYFYLGSIYFSLGDVMNGLKYTEKAYELSLKFNLYSHQLSTYMSVMCIYDYFLYDHKEYIRKARELESMYVVDASKRFNPKIGRNRAGKIRIGYVSSDFNLHVVSHFILPILRNHDLNRFELYLYINLEEIHEYYRNIPAFKRIILNADDYVVAELIQKDAIDILIDLNGNTLNNRLGVFAYNPAPIQMTYLGHPSSTFMKSIQYKIVDSITNPLDSIQYHTEELVRMKGCFLLYEHNIQYSPPITHRLSNRREIVFGSFNKESKNSEYILEIWGRILREVENSKIKIKLDSFDNAEARLAYYAEKMNVSPDRIIILTKLHDKAYMELFVDVDILLDTSPYSGTTTTCHSLYNSLPIITLYNKDYHCHNVSASLLIHTGLERMVAKSPDEYVEIAKYMVANIDWFNEYKKGIRDKFLALMNPRRFMSEYEAMLGSLVQKHAH
jgi:predicted O-linked N-acetylglucosamine transferase (SPINDLY family)